MQKEIQDKFVKKLKKKEEEYKKVTAELVSTKDQISCNQTKAELISLREEIKEMREKANFTGPTLTKFFPEGTCGSEGYYKPSDSPATNLDIPIRGTSGSGGE